MRPTGITDLDLIWAIRDIPKQALHKNLKHALNTMVATIGNNHKDWFYHSHAEWAKVMNCGERVIPEYMNSLEELQFIFINRLSYYGNGHSNEYKLNYKFILDTAEYWRSK